MFGTFPNVPPSGTGSVWYTSTYFAPAYQDPVHVASPANPTAAAERVKRVDRALGGSNGRPSALQLLQAEESEMRKRKTNVARFGATWIRPPGIPKTLQAMMDEAAERAEQEAMATREAAAAEQQAAFEAQQQQDEQEARRQQRIAQMEQAGILFSGPVEMEDEQEGERDLDDDVPDADDAGFEFSDDDEDDDEEEAEVDLDATDEDAGGTFMDEEHDLDDDVPEAGSYQHTDTDVEDESTDAGFTSPATQQLPVPNSQATSPAEGVQGMTVVQDFSQPSLARLPVPSFAAATSSPGVAAESSMLMSSPGVPRGRGAGQARGTGVAAARRNIGAVPPLEWSLRPPARGSDWSPPSRPHGSD